MRDVHSPAFFYSIKHLKNVSLVSFLLTVKYMDINQFWDTIRGFWFIYSSRALFLINGHRETLHLIDWSQCQIRLIVTTRLGSVLLISQGPTLNDDLSASSSSSVEVSGLQSEAKMSGRSQTLVLSSDEVHMYAENIYIYIYIVLYKVMWLH